MATKTPPKPTAKQPKARATKAKPSTKPKPAAREGKLPRAKVTPGVLIPIQTFAPEPYELKRPILAVVRLCRREYEATLFDAGLTAFGTDPGRAVENLKMMLLHHFDMLSAEGPRLVPMLANRLAVLRDFVVKSADGSAGG